jgi:predicted DNA-binding transcriptional regulator AlpA
MTFEDIPKTLEELLAKVDQLQASLERMNPAHEEDRSLSVEELSAYHPDHPSQQTVRRWKRLGYFPYYKDGETRRVKFKKSEIDAWIASSRHMSRQERNALHDAQILARQRQMEIGGLDDE